MFKTTEEREDAIFKYYHGGFLISANDKYQVIVFCLTQYNEIDMYASV